MVECEFVDDFNYGLYQLKYSKANWLNMDGILLQVCTMTADLVASVPNPAVKEVMH